MKLDVQPVLLGPGEGETTTDRPERTIQILCELEQIIVSRFRYDPGEKGPDPHVHRQHADAFYVLEGEVGFGLGPQVERFTGGPGTFACAPRNVTHTFRNSSDQPATFLNVHAPSLGFGDVLRGGGHEGFDQFDPPPDGGRQLGDAIFNPAGEGERVGHERTSHLIKCELDELSVFEMTFFSGFEGVDPHVHADLVDSFFVLEGEGDFTAGDDVHRLTPGCFISAPAGARHGFTVAGTEPLRVLNLHAPDRGFADRLRD